MKKTAVALALLSLCALSEAQTSPQTYTYTKHGVEYSITISNWKLDQHRIPSFDYSYEQKGGKDGVCNFQKAGHAVADTVDSGHGIEVNVYVGQNDDTMTDTEYMSYSDGDALFSSVYGQKKMANEFSFEYSKTSTAFNKSCLFKERHLIAYFEKPKKH
jgi:hypothetical protein